MLHFERLLEACKAEGQYKVLSHISKAQPFVFQKFVNGMSEATIAPEYKLDLPFKVCAFELLPVDGEHYCVTYHNKDHKDLRAYLCIVAEEIEPQKIIFYTFEQTENGIGVSWYHPDDEGQAMWKFLAHQVQLFLNHLKTGQHGHSSPRTVFKWKANGEKLQTRINKVIYVRPRQSEETEGTRLVQWSHAFWVMGHWRTVRGLGKDRDGNYNVAGKTWVSEFVKNANAGDPVRKVRINLENE